MIDRTIVLFFLVWASVFEWKKITIEKSINGLRSVEEFVQDVAKEYSVDTENPFRSID